MKRIVPSLLSFCAATAFAANVDHLATVSNVSFTQDAQQDVIVTYDLANNGEPAFVTFDVLTNGVPLPVAAVQSVTGDVSASLTDFVTDGPGKTIRWKARPTSSSVSVFSALRNSSAYARESLNVSKRSTAANSRPPFFRIAATIASWVTPGATLSATSRRTGGNGGGGDTRPTASKRARSGFSSSSQSAICVVSRNGCRSFFPKQTSAFSISRG